MHKIEILRCEDCGLPYEDPTWIDCTLPNDQWLMIHPAGESGVLCGACMIKRAVNLIPSMTAIRMWFDNSPDLDVTNQIEYADIEGDSLSITKCVCGKEYKSWDFILHTDRDWAAECYHCHRKFYFRDTVQVFEI